MGNNYRNLYFFTLIMIFMLVTTSCGDKDQEIVRSTANAMARTMNFQTHQAETAMITDTPVPSKTPTQTLTETPNASPTFWPTITGLPPHATNSFDPPPPTNTPLPSNSPSPLDTPTIDYSAYPTYTPLPFLSKNQYSTVRFVNSTGKQAAVRLNGAKIYETSVDKSTILNVRFDTYYFTIFIGKDGPYNGSILINSADRYTIFIDEGNVRVATP